MWWRSTRDVCIEAVTIVKGLRRSFDDHVEKEDLDRDRLFDAISKAHENCPESPHIKIQNGTLGRMEKKSNLTHDEVMLIKDEIKGFKKATSVKREMVMDGIRLIGVACIVLGCWYGYARYCATKKLHADNKIEKMLEEILENKNAG
jgi:hypothetical protein